jgi:hypothetical protein
VLEADDRNEPAWLWLSAALDKPGDQLMARGRVLAINPRSPRRWPAYRLCDNTWAFPALPRNLRLRNRRLGSLPASQSSTPLRFCLWLMTPRRPGRHQQPS